MARLKVPVNPFYVLVVALGVVFTVTAFAYAVMAFRAVAPTVDPKQTTRLEAFLDRYGVQTLAAELAVLGIVTLGAMWLDQVQTPDDLLSDVRNPGRRKRRIVIALVLSLALVPVLIFGLWLLGELGRPAGG